MVILVIGGAGFIGSNFLNTQISYFIIRTYNIPVKITNSSNNYGPYQFPEKLIP